MLDGDSNASYVHADVLIHLGVQSGERTLLKIQTYGSKEFTSVPSSSIIVTFCDLYGERRVVCYFFYQ